MLPAPIGSAATTTRCFLREPTFGTRETMGYCGLENISASTTEDKVYLVLFLDDLGPIKLSLPPARYTTPTGAVRGSWCLQVHIASAFPWGIQRDADESRGATVASCLSNHRRSSITLHFFSGLWGLEVLPLGCSRYFG